MLPDGNHVHVQAVAMGCGNKGASQQGVEGNVSRSGKEKVAAAGNKRGNAGMEKLRETNRTRKPREPPESDSIWRPTRKVDIKVERSGNKKRK